jgi:hypothetical protein
LLGKNSANISQQAARQANEDISELLSAGLDWVITYLTDFFQVPSGIVGLAARPIYSRV